MASLRIMMLRVRLLRMISPRLISLLPTLVGEETLSEEPLVERYLLVMRTIKGTQRVITPLEIVYRIEQRFP